MYLSIKIEHKNTQPAKRIVKLHKLCFSELSIKVGLNWLNGIKLNNDNFF